MKITIDVDLTPRELRVFLGLPDVKPLQDEMLERIQEKMRGGAEGFDPVSLMKPLMGQGMQSFETLQKAFWDALLSGKKATVSAEESEPKNTPTPAPKKPPAEPQEPQGPPVETETRKS